MRTTVKSDLKLSLLKPKKHQHLTVLQQERELVFFWICWNLARKSDKNIHFGGKVQSTKCQSDGLTLRGRSWRHINCLSLPEASICCGLGCSVKKLEIFFDFCETVCQSTSMIFWPLPCEIWNSFSKMKISPFNRTVLPLTPQIKFKLGSKTISCGFGAKNVGLLHRPISTHWTSVFGPCWKLRSVAHHTRLWSHWKYL